MELLQLWKILILIYYDTDNLILSCTEVLSRKIVLLLISDVWVN